MSSGGIIKISTNSERSMKITGDTRPIKDKIKELGGSWNKGISGWIFPTKHKDKFVTGLKEVAEVQVEGEDFEEGEDGSPAAKKAKKEDEDAGDDAEAAAPAAGGDAAGAGDDVEEEGESDNPPPKKAADGSLIWELGKPNRQVRLSCYKNAWSVRIGEVYQQNGEGDWLPGKKGISFDKASFDKLYNVVEDLAEAANNEQEDFAVDLDNKTNDRRRATVSKFKGKLYVNLRCYYQKNGQGDWLPTQKGCMMDMDGFQVLVNLLDDINKAFDAKFA